MGSLGYDQKALQSKMMVSEIQLKDRLGGGTGKMLRSHSFPNYYYKKHTTNG